MCGRYALDVTGEAIAAAFQACLGSADAWCPSWNVAPTRDAPVIRRFKGEVRVDALRWGLVPPWSKDPSEGARMINARAETIAAKPAYRNAFRERRCLVPVRAFYEWMGPAGRRRPVAIRSRTEELLVLAGLWETVERGEGRILETFTIVTTAAGPALEPIHHRMPVILRGVDRDHWLDQEVRDPHGIGTGSPGSVLASATDGGLRFHAVSKRVGSVRNDGPDLLEEVSLESLEREDELPDGPGLFDDPVR